MTSKKINTDTTTPEVGVLDMIHKSNYWIMDAEAVGDTDRIINIVNTLERILSPFRDKEYGEDIDKFVQSSRPKKANTSARRTYNANMFAIGLARAKHEALMNLCARIGFYPIKSLRATTKMDAVGKSYDYNAERLKEELGIGDDDITEDGPAVLDEVTNVNDLDAELLGIKQKKTNNRRAK